MSGRTRERMGKQTQTANAHISELLCFSRCCGGLGNGGIDETGDASIGGGVGIGGVEGIAEACSFGTAVFDAAVFLS